jgi:hypothetical protein
MNRTLTDLVNCMLDTTRLSKAWWKVTLLTSCHVLNRVPIKNKEKTPYEQWIGKKPSPSYLRIWGYLAKVNVPINKKRKLGPKIVDIVFLGYAHHSITYRFLVIKSEIPDMHVDTFLEYRDVTFFDNIFPMKNSYGMSSLPANMIVDTSSEPSKNFDHAEDTLESIHEEIDSEASRRSKIPRTVKSFGDDFTVYLVDDTPKTIVEAFASPDMDDWKEAVRSEIDSILSNETWELVDRPYGCKPVVCKRVLKKKLRVDGTIDKYKARLVTKGYTQKEGKDFFDNYSPIARLTTIHVLLSLVVSHGLLIHQMDVKIAFLNGELEEESYMTQPDGFIVKGQDDKVCKLVKSLYGLKQEPKQWHEKFGITLISTGFSVNEVDRCVYYCHGGGQ